MRAAALGLGLAATLLAGLAQAQTAPAAATPAREWPGDGAPARVRFARSLDPASMRPRPSAFSRMLRVIVGAEGAAPVMEQPYGSALGPDGRLYVVDSSAGLIHVFGLDKAFYRAVRVDDAESLIGIVFTGRRMVVTDSVKGRVSCLDLDGHVVWRLDRRNGFERPTGIAASQGRLFVVDTLANRVVTVSSDGKVLGQFGRRGVEPGQLNYPTSIAADADGRLYVVDTMNFRVQTFSADGRPLGGFGQLGDGAGDFDKPKGIAVDADGLVYVVEGLHDAVKIFDHDSRLLLVFAGSGNGPGDLWLPTGITLAAGHVFVTDTANHRVQVYDRVGGVR